jgi:hypothetical protein
VKLSPALEKVVRTSHGRVVEVDLLDPDGVVVDRVPVDGRGSVLGTARSTDRWSGRITVPITDPGRTWLPRSPADPLSGFSGHSLLVRVGALVDRSPVTVPVARLWPFSSKLRRTADTVELDVELVGPASLAQQAAGREHTALPGESCQAMIVRLLRDAVPHDPAVLDSTTPDDPPDGYTSDRDVWSTVLDLSARAGVVTYFDAAGDLVIRDPLPPVAGPGELALSAQVNVTGYRLTIGRDQVANEVRARFRGTDGETDLIGVAQVTTGPLAVTGPAGRIVETVDVDLVAGSQARANRYARSLLDAMLAAWVTVDVDHVPDPRIEPDDLVDLVYLDGTRVAHRVVTVAVPLGVDGTQRLTARTADPAQVAPRAALLPGG